ncbi:MAG TPA: DUF4270 family protein [Bacteroidales bacterium]|nr:DUF4270 family protein [Bacteroidales bacterium]
MTRFYHSSGYSRGSGAVSQKSFCIILAFFTLTGLFMVSCEEDPTIIGKELLPATDFVSIQSTDTITPVSYTMFDDSVSTENPSTSYLGQVWDPYFGTTTASFVSQIRLKEDWDGKAFTVDSMKLMLQLSVSGGTQGTHTLSISEIAKDLSTTEKYYSTTQVPLAGFSMDIPLPAMKADTVNSITIKLTDLSLANRILADTSKLFHSNKIPDFRSYFKGLYFKLTSTGEPMMTQLSLAHTGSTDGYFIIDRYYSNFFVIYLHDSAGNKKEFYLILDAVNRNASFNIYNHDFTTAEPGKRIQHYNDPSYRDSLSYLQTLNGFYTKIVFPGLQQLKNSGKLDSVAVNKARLTIPYYFDRTLYESSDIPGQIYLRYRTTDGKRYTLPDLGISYDATYDYSSFLDGSRDTTKQAYHFNIPSFIQEYLNDDKNVIVPELEVYLKRGIRNGILKANNSSTPVKFEFTYTRF